VSEVHFSDIRNEIIKNIRQSEKDLKIAVAWFTDKKILEEVNEVAKRGVSVEIIVYDDKINKKQHFEKLYYSNVKVHLYRNLMHNKFCIIDKNIIINGSYNWTFKASTNKENIQISRGDTKLTNKFLEEFTNLLGQSKSIDGFFKYSTDNLVELQNEFEDFLGDNKYFSFPYVYNLSEIKFSTVNKNSRFKTGLYLIKTENEERDFFWQIFFLRSNFFLKKINSILHKEIFLPERFDFIDTVKSKYNAVHSLNEEKHLVETHNRYKYVFLIDKNGSLIGEKIQFTNKLPNGLYLQNFSDWGSAKFLFDTNLKKYLLNVINIKVHNKIGLICESKSLNYGDQYLIGVLDFFKKEVIGFKYNKYDIDEENEKIYFTEYPFIERNINNNSFRNVSNYNLDNLPYKQQIYNFKGILLNKKEKDCQLNKSSETNIEYLYLGEKDGLYADLYTSTSASIYGTKFPMIRENGISTKQLFDLKRNINEKGWSGAMCLELTEKILVMEDQRHQMYNTGKYAKKGSCYVATMVYTNYEHPKVKILRKFRDDTLTRSKIGRNFIQFYYKNSPYLVSYLKKKPILKRMVSFLINSVVIIISTWHNKVYKILFVSGFRKG
jgi:hypothetical protein